MKTIVIFLLTIVVLQLSLAQNTGLQTFIADFTVTASQYNYGYFNGQVYYDWTQYAFLLTFPVADEYSELYIFNSNQGYNENLLNGQFSGQYLYKNSSICLCETTSLVYSMPLFYLDDGTDTGLDVPMWSPDPNPPATTLTYNGHVCSGYIVNPDATPDNQLVSYFWQWGTTPCGFTFTDGRTFTLTNVQKATIPSSRWQAPVDCKCGKPIDVVVSLDRTGSIMIWEWIIQHNFTQNLVQAFDYGPLKTNLGIVDWNSNFWVTISLTAGISADAVNTAVAAMGCCNNPPTTDIYASCCCCGTPIGGGLYYAAQMMLTSQRSSATKVIILVTDGCQNHIYDTSVNPPQVQACVCSGSTEQSCQTDIPCIQDITTHYQQVVAAIPGIKIIAVGVGNDQQICTLQLNEVAGGIAANVFNPQSWQDLSSLVQSISATACDVVDKACTGCCGICSCGACVKPIACQPPDMCTVASVSLSSNCCAIEPLVCPQQPCHTVTCDPKHGCIYTPFTCPLPGNCTTWNCVNSTNTCMVTTTCSAPQCYTSLNCNDNNKCTVDHCIGGNCSWTPLPCPKSNNCTTFTCDPVQGCLNYTIVCNDHNLCTRDSCVGNVLGGCVFAPITCNSTNACYKTSCDPIAGCINQPVVCNLTTNNCTVVACFNGSCGRQSVCLPPPIPSGNEVTETAIIGGSIGAAALAGIVIGAVALAAGLAGGGAAAVASASGAAGTSSIFNNPLYTDTSCTGTSPLYKPA